MYLWNILFNKIYNVLYTIRRDFLFVLYANYRKAQHSKAFIDRLSQIIRRKEVK